MIAIFVEWLDHCVTQENNEPFPMQDFTAYKCLRAGWSVSKHL